MVDKIKSKPVYLKPTFGFIANIFMTAGYLFIDHINITAIYYPIFPKAIDFNIV
jgi:hypothetical protein